MGFWRWITGRKEPATPVGTLTLVIGGSTVQFQFTITGKAPTPAFHHFAFVPATAAIDYGQNLDIHVFTVDQFGAQAPATVQSVTSPDARFTVKPIAGGFNVAFGGTPSAADVVANLAGQAT